MTKGSRNLTAKEKSIAVGFIKESFGYSKSKIQEIASKFEESILRKRWKDKGMPELVRMRNELKEKFRDAGYDFFAEGYRDTSYSISGEINAKVTEAISHLRGPFHDVESLHVFVAAILASETREDFNSVMAHIAMVLGQIPSDIKDCEMKNIRKILVGDVVEETARAIAEFEKEHGVKVEGLGSSIEEIVRKIESKNGSNVADDTLRDHEERDIHQE